MKLIMNYRDRAAKARGAENKGVRMNQTTQAKRAIRQAESTEENCYDCEPSR